MIEVSIKCPCGTHAVITITGGDAANRWSCRCPKCLDPTEDSGALAHLQGYGADPEQSIADWWEKVELEWEIDYEPVMLFAELSEQAGDEADRQEGWIWSAPRGGAPNDPTGLLVHPNSARWFGPGAGPGAGPIEVTP